MISYLEIEILPFEGQHEPKVLQPIEQKVEVVHEEIVVAAPVKPSSFNTERKKIAEPTGKLNSTIIGIKSTLNPTVKKHGLVEDVSSDLNENYKIEDLEYAWKEYALGVKREKKDSLFSTLTTSEFKVSSDHIITLKLKNSIQSTEIEEEKINLVRFLRSKLQNSNIQLNYEMEESQAIKVMDSKSTFDKLAEENQALHKFRKLFNLDIEF
ncbi:MAG: hypothetical protein R2780_06595 [Crocinitomicaceae bacterium]|nr:hypothetical protein [Crocinitomicaceae bacterium]